jgi:tetratricopeptide (TPR) repeat protein
MPYSALELADSFIKVGEISDALDTLNTFLAAGVEDAPTHDAARRLRASILQRRDDADQLREAVRDLDALNAPTADDELTRSILLERLGDLAGSLAALARAQQSRPDDERLIERQIQLLAAAGQAAQALEIAASRATPADTTWRWHQWAGDLAAQMRDNDNALLYYDSAIAMLTQRPPDRWLEAVRARLLCARAAIFQEQRDYDRADKDYAAAQTLIPDDPMIVFNRGVIAALQGDTEPARAAIHSAYQTASPTLRDLMRTAVRGDVRLAGLIEDQ